MRENRIIPSLTVCNSRRLKIKHFKLVSDFAPTGDQPQAIKALAARLHGEFNEFFPENAVEYLVKEAKRDRLDDIMWIK